MNINTLKTPSLLQKSLMYNIYIKLVRIYDRKQNIGNIEKADYKLLHVEVNILILIIILKSD